MAAGRRLRVAFVSSKRGDASGAVPDRAWLEPWGGADGGARPLDRGHGPKESRVEARRQPERRQQASAREIDGDGEGGDSSKMFLNVSQISAYISS